MPEPLVEKCDKKIKKIKLNKLKFFFIKKVT